MMSRCISFTLQPSSMKRRASQSSSSGCDGRSPSMPKLSVLATMPLPKCQRHSAVHEDARGERMFAAGHPAREFEAAALLRRAESAS